MEYLSRPAAYQEPCSEWVSAHGAAAGEEIEL